MSRTDIEKGEVMAEKRNPMFDCISPIDYRYVDPDVAYHLSGRAVIRSQLAVEIALVRALHRMGLCSEAVVEEIQQACDQVTAEEVDAEELRTRHDIRALVNCIQRRVSEAARPFVHMGATSYDVVDTARARQYREVTATVVIPELIKLEAVLIRLAERYADTVQIGRTHGQHAVPITFGFAIAQYVSRLGQSIEAIQGLADRLPGKFSGAVGAYNATSLLFGDPEELERSILDELHLSFPECSTQIVQPEPSARFFMEIAILAGILGNLADDMRNLQRTEIGEVGEEFASGQVGSSTMAHKRNPISFENAKSLFKVVIGRSVAVLLDLISEHQRDLTNSASQRTHAEMIAYVVTMTRRLTKAMDKLTVDEAALRRNFETQSELIIAEPLYIILASLGHPNAHEKIRQLSQQSRDGGRPLIEAVRADAELSSFFERMEPQQIEVLSDPAKYVGMAPRRARAVASHWKARLSIA
jgi:adenylosuccinate lyase